MRRGSGGDMENNRDQIRTIAAVRADRDIHKMPLKESQLMAVQLLNRGILHREPSEDQGEYAYELRVNQIILQRLLSIKINAHYDSESDKELVLEDIASKTAYIKRYLSYQIDGFRPEQSRTAKNIEVLWHTALREDVIRPFSEIYQRRPSTLEAIKIIQTLVDKGHKIFMDTNDDELRGTTKFTVNGRARDVSQKVIENQLSHQWQKIRNEHK